MAITAKMVTIDCADPRQLSNWWGEALGAQILADYDEFIMVGAGAVALGFQRVPEPKSGKNRVHLDFEADDYEGEIKRLVGLGASVVAEHSAGGDFRWSVLRDPEGNEFDVSVPHT
jgi:predicted enzyme related to lactoylglutathione lyase